VLIHHQDQVRPAEIASLAQFSGQALGLIYSFIRIREALTHLIGKNFWAVQDMKKISGHEESPHAK
jgi:hypothetical protein